MLEQPGTGTRMLESTCSICYSGKHCMRIVLQHSQEIRRNKKQICRATTLLRALICLQLKFTCYESRIYTSSFNLATNVSRRLSTLVDRRCQTVRASRGIDELIDDCNQLIQSHLETLIGFGCFLLKKLHQ